MKRNGILQYSLRSQKLSVPNQLIDITFGIGTMLKLQSQSGDHADLEDTVSLAGSSSRSELTAPINSV